MFKYDTGNYPRPDFVRTEWESLNGIWEFSFDEEFFDKKILVPFTYQSQKSGIGDSTFHEVVWYRRTFQVPQNRKNANHILLKFGAVDYEAFVYINGNFVGTHVGGYSPFEIDITKYLQDGKNELKVKVVDGQEIDKPRGKQSWTGENFVCWYTPMTGIWQDVWLEYVQDVHIKQIKITPDLEQNLAMCEVFISDNRKCEVEISSIFDAAKREETVDLGSNKILCKNGYGRGTIIFPEFGYLRKWYTWSLEQPNLIWVTAELKENNDIKDKVTTYFGMRSVEMTNNHFYLNRELRMQRLILNQGYWEDTLLTPPDDEAIKKDLQLIKEMGFNGIRMHQKIEHPKFYYWADRMGLLVWGELPSAFQYCDTMVRNTVRDMLDFVERDYNHPSIVAWVPVNESWGVSDVKTDAQQQSYVDMMYHLIKSVDYTRAISGNDGWEQTGNTDILAIHDYGLLPNSVHKYDDMSQIIGGVAEKRQVLVDGQAYEDQPVMITEYGGIALNSGSDGWGYYKQASSKEEFLERIEFITDFIIKSRKFAGFCYTQFTDVMQEQNGLLYMDRTPKAEIEEFKRIFNKRYFEE